jgi:hypothetical protein
LIPKSCALLILTTYNYAQRTWVVDLEHAGALVAYGNILTYKKIIERYLNSNYCKKILPWSEMGKQFIFTVLIVSI